MPDAQKQLTAKLAEYVGDSTAVEVVGHLSRGATGTAAMSGVLLLFEELERMSAKAAAYAAEAFSELMRRDVCDSVPVIISWLDLGGALAESSGAAAIKYFKDSPLVLSLVQDAARETVLRQALELAEADPNLALEFFRSAPDLLSAVPSSDLPRWMEMSRELAQVDYVLAVEFVKHSAAAARSLGLEDVRAWVAFGMKLITQNSLGKTDYLPTLEFFRCSPAIFEAIESPVARRGVMAMGTALADRDPASAIAYLAESPTVLRRLPTEPLQTRVLGYGALLAERDAEAALAYFRRSPEILEMIGNAPDALETFESWYRSGMDVLELSAEGARAYFSLETHRALSSVEEAASGVPLRQVARSLNLFAEALCGSDISIRALPETAASPATLRRPSVSPDGRTIALPALLRHYPTRDENLRLYTVMTAHEAGHLEFGTYRLNHEGLESIAAAAQARFRPGDAAAHDSTMTTLEDLFLFYPQPALIRDLWTLLEDARVECHLKLEYPGLADDLAKAARESVNIRTLSHGMTVREMVVDYLLVLTTAGREDLAIPDAVAGLVEGAWGMTQAVLRADATAEDAVRTAHALYVFLEDHIGSQPAPSERGEDHRPDIAGGPNASESEAAYRPVTNWIYRGDMDPRLVKSRTTEESPDQEPGVEPAPLRDAGRDPGRHVTHAVEARSRRDESPGRAHDAEQPDDRGREQPRAAPHEAVFVYDEWDGTIADYRSGWCRLIERTVPSGDRDFAEATMRAYAPIAKTLRRYFESLRPSGLRRMFAQIDGDELDLDATIRRVVDRRAGAEGSDRIYVHRDKRDRSVAAAFLVDLSGSTSRQISGGRRIIDVEKEALVLLSEALEAIGDRYAIYGYSGQARRHVDFVVLKDFDEPAARSAARIGTVAPLQQNRDGTAIRHAVRKLLAPEAKARLLILISDGRPLDESYADEYALEDTKRALQEARRLGVHTFCITVDRDADDYVRRMYGDVHYLVIDDVAALPERLPAIYRRLTA
jgi:hypothetical protein